MALYLGIAYGFIGIGAAVFIALFFITAPYGRHVRPGWGPPLDNRLAWVLMEGPAALMMLVYFFTGARFDLVPIVLLVLWEAHYMERAFIYPFLIDRGKKMPLGVVLFGVMFNLLNTYLQGRWLFVMNPEGSYAAGWFLDPRFILGAALFIAGYVVNRWADSVILRLKRNSPGTYSLPKGGMYELVSCPNYFGELVIWLGWAVMTWSLAGWTFLFWTAANLVPRALSNHKWYLKTFPDYPANRKALIPFVF
ncbi:MAG: hypothetical protein A2Y33_08630 [Spirochaetes bacterium GWF1_51_8]|nr:MAG: hypothetical protein A2Y33_08630 [Spirochaetes bacterium GWF1_51_8]